MILSKIPIKYLQDLKDERRPNESISNKASTKAPDSPVSGSIENIEKKLKDAGLKQSRGRSKKAANKYMPYYLTKLQAKEKFRHMIAIEKEINLDEDSGSLVYGKMGSKEKSPSDLIDFIQIDKKDMCVSTDEQGKSDKCTQSAAKVDDKNGGGENQPITDLKVDEKDEKTKTDLEVIDKKVNEEEKKDEQPITDLKVNDKVDEKDEKIKTDLEVIDKKVNGDEKKDEQITKVDDKSNEVEKVVEQNGDLIKSKVKDSMNGNLEESAQEKTKPEEKPNEDVQVNQKDVEKSLMKSTDESIGKSTAESKGKSTVESIDKSAVESIGKSTVESIGKSINESIGKSIVKSIGESIVKSISESIGKSLGKSIGKSNPTEIDKTSVESKSKEKSTSKPANVDDDLDRLIKLVEKERESLDKFNFEENDEEEKKMVKEIESNLQLGNLSSNSSQMEKDEKIQQERQRLRDELDGERSTSFKVMLDLKDLESAPDEEKGSLISLPNDAREEAKSAESTANKKTNEKDNQPKTNEVKDDKQTKLEDNSIRQPDEQSPIQSKPIEPANVELNTTNDNSSKAADNQAKLSEIDQQTSTVGNQIDEVKAKSDNQNKIEDVPADSSKKT